MNATENKNGAFHLYAIGLSEALDEFLTQYQDGLFRAVKVRRQLSDTDFPHTHVRAPQVDRFYLIVDMTQGLRPSDIGWVFDHMPCGGGEWLPSRAMGYAYDRVLNPEWDGVTPYGKSSRPRSERASDQEAGKVHAFRRQLECARMAFATYQSTRLEDNDDLKIDRLDQAVVISYLASPYRRPEPKRPEVKGKRPEGKKPKRKEGTTQQGATAKLGDIIPNAKEVTEAVTAKVSQSKRRRLNAKRRKAEAKAAEKAQEVACANGHTVVDGSDLKVLPLTAANDPVMGEVVFMDSPSTAVSERIGEWKTDAMKPVENLNTPDELEELERVVRDARERNAANAANALLANGDEKASDIITDAPGRPPLTDQEKEAIRSLARSSENAIDLPSDELAEKANAIRSDKF